MKQKLLCMMLFLGMLTLMFISCSSDDEKNESSITKEEVVGTWIIIDGYETNGETTYTGRVGSSAFFQADGSGSIDGVSIKWSLSGNRFSCYYTSNRNIVFSGTSSYNNGILVLKGTGNGWTFEYIMKKRDNSNATTLIGTWKCTSSISTYNGKIYTNVLKGDTITLKSDGTFTSTTVFIGKSGTWSQQENILNLNSTDGGIITLEYTIFSDVLTAKGYNSLGEAFDCTFTKQ